MTTMGDFYRDNKVHMNDVKADHLRVAEDTKWPVEWSISPNNCWFTILGGKRLSYWPTTNKFQYKGKIYTGDPKSLIGFISKRITI